MSADQAKRAATKWLASLWDQSRKPKDETTPEARRRAIAVYAADLAPYFSADAFTDASLRAVRGEYWPSLAVLEQALREWCRDNLHTDAQDGGEGPEVAALSDEDKAWYRYWQRHHVAREREENEIRGAGTWRDEAQLPLVLLSSLVRQYGGDAWRVIAGAPVPRPWVDPEVIRDLVRQATSGPARAPHGQTVDTRPTLPAPAKAKPIDPGVLAAMRDANPAVQAARAAAEEIAEERGGIDWGA